MVAQREHRPGEGGAPPGGMFAARATAPSTCTDSVASTTGAPGRWPRACTDTWSARTAGG